MSINNIKHPIVIYGKRLKTLFPKLKIDFDTAKSLYGVKYDNSDKDVFISSESRRYNDNTGEVYLDRYVNLTSGRSDIYRKSVDNRVYDKYLSICSDIDILSDSLEFLLFLYNKYINLDQLVIYKNIISNKIDLNKLNQFIMNSEVDAKVEEFKKKLINKKLGVKNE